LLVTYLPVLKAARAVNAVGTCVEVSFPPKDPPIFGTWRLMLKYIIIK
jgi:hypothetical protein